MYIVTVCPPATRKKTTCTKREWEPINNSFLYIPGKKTILLPVPIAAKFFFYHTFAPTSQVMKWKRYVKLLERGLVICKSYPVLPFYPFSSPSSPTSVSQAPKADN